MKHTKGPWKMVRSKDGSMHIRTDGANFSSVVAEGILSDENACLITTAPEMLQLLLDVENYLTSKVIDSKSSALVERIGLIKEELGG